MDAIRRREYLAAEKIALFASRCIRWRKTLNRLEEIRLEFKRERARKRLRKSRRFVAAVVRFNAMRRERNQRLAREARFRAEVHSLQVISFFIRRIRELSVLRTRFEMRKRTLQALKELESERIRAEQQKFEAIEEVKRNEENMKVTIAAAWKQGSDASGRNYFYNYVTGESRLEAIIGGNYFKVLITIGGHLQKIGK